MSDHAQLIVKVAERCNLACTYCYMYTAGDQSWRDRPAFLAEDLQRRLVDHCASYLEADPYRQLTLEFHGGEPLLLGKPAFARLLGEIHERLDMTRVLLCVQTNGTLLDEAWCDLFEAHDMVWSISCDGPPPVNDRFRLHHSGASSAAAVERAIRLSVARASRRFGGVLSVVDPRNDPAAIVRYFHRLGVRDFDLLMPDASHAARPGHLPGLSNAALREFLVRAFDAWIAIGDPSFRIRLFAHMVRGIFGMRSGLDAFGGELWGMMVVESDGSYQLLDVLRIHGEGEVATGLRVVDHDLEAVLAATAGKSPQACASCRACPVFSVCGGGYLPHRFDGVGYDRPSVYCDVLYDLIAHIQDHLQRVTPPELWAPRSADDVRMAAAAP